MPSETPMLAMRPNQIQNLQRILKAQGLYNGRVSGQWDARTQRALRAFQRRNGLTVTGAYDTATDQYMRDAFQRVSVGSRPIHGVDDATLRFIRETYGYLSVYLRHPELGPIIIQAARDHWDDLRLNARLRETRWWRTTAPSARSWFQQVWEDPAGVRRQREGQEANIRDQMFRLGVRLRPHRLSAIVEMSLQMQWSPEEIADALVAESHFNGGDLPTGQIATDAQRVAQLRAQYLLPHANTDRSNFRLAQRIAAGEMTLDDLTAQFSQQAANLYGHLANQLNQGVSMADLFDGHRQAIADELELDPDSIDLTQPRWSEVVTYNAPGGTDRARAMTIGEARILARSQPGAARTAGYREGAARLATTLGQSFGILG
jgi:hypothetical protein